MKLFTKSEESSTKCKKCGLELHDAERLKKHEKIAKPYELHREAVHLVLNL